MRAETPATPRISFTVSTPVPSNHLYQIVMDIPPFSRGVSSFDLVMPVWAPGSYSVRDFSRNVRDLLVETGSGHPLHAEKATKNVWRVSVPEREREGPFRVVYRVYANELTVRTSHLDSSHAYGNGTNLFFYVEGRKDEPQALRFLLPSGWVPTIALPSKDGVFEACNYDELVDSPFECGTHRILEFEVEKKPHVLALWGRGNENEQRLVNDLRKIVEAAAKMFGGLPYDRYVFLVHIAAGAGGGLEHKNSQSVGIAPFRFRPEKEYRDVLALFAHELFHVWNVKRIRPAGLGPFDYTKEVYTRDLWAMEGITSYYEGLLLVRAGLIEPKHAFEEWSKMLTGHLDTPGSCVQSAEESSFDTWIRLYKPDENSVNVSESYYRRGAVVGLALDLAIRQASSGKRSLDDVLRLLMAEYGLLDTAYPEGAYEEAIRKATGFDPAEFFARFVRTPETPGLKDLLASAGVELIEKPDKEDDAENGREKSRSVRVKADFGWKTKTENGKLTVQEVYEGRAAQNAGVDAKDEVIAIDGVRADEDQLKRIARDVTPGSTVLLHVFRRDALKEISLTLGAKRAFTYEMKPSKEATAEEKQFFELWLEKPFPLESGQNPAERAERLE